MFAGDFATIPAIPMGYPTTVTCSPGELGDLANGRMGKPLTRLRSCARRIARSDVLDTAAGSRFTGVGEPGKKITRLSRVAEAPRFIKASDSESPYQGSATWRLVASKPSPTRKPVPETRARTAGRWFSNPT